MTNLNRFLLTLHRSPRMRNLSVQEKQKRIDKIMQDKDLTKILKPIKCNEEDSDYYYFYEKFDEETEKRIVEKQKEVEKYEKNKGLTKKISKKNIKQKKINIKNGRFGRTDLHEAVLSGDKEAVKYLLKDMKRSDLFIKDNNKQNPFQLALLEEKKELIEIMRPYYSKEVNDEERS